MPRFDIDFSNVDASIPVYDKGRYQLKVTKAKPFFRMTRDDRLLSGVQYNFEMIGQYDNKGKLVREDLEGRAVESNTVWTHTEKAFGIGKQFLMAAMGYRRDEEDKANKEFFAKNDFHLNGEPGEEGDAVDAGDGWFKPVGRIVDVNLDERTWESDDGKTGVNQDFSGWAPPAA